MAKPGGNLESDDEKKHLDDKKGGKLDDSKKLEKPNFEKNRQERHQILDQVKKQIELGEKAYNASKIVLETIGYSKEQAENFLESNPELAEQLIGAVYDVIENSGPNLKITKPNPFGEYLNLEFPSRRIAGLSSGGRAPLFNDNGALFFADNVNEIVFKIIGGQRIKKAPAQKPKKDQFEELAEQHKNEKITGGNEIQKLEDSYFNSHPYYKIADQLYADADKNYENEELRGLINKGKETLAYSLKHMAETKNSYSHSFHDQINEFIKLLNSALNSIDSGEFNNEELMEEIDNAWSRITIGVAAWKTSSYLSKNELDSNVINEYVNREICDMALRGIVSCIRELINRYKS
ncbi:MAG: hypothetical protein US89_C0013G0023 [Candidatus Peregrinibacteria bacterium GW2011_GWF2_38_29]|nr:MAG: hypothetical protein US89_C0013G0023 [Candidatus Peregrinibacteria bacterium GW2011_GWF2_38_29]HBB02404.1 hypothetical protein [Candidatus Peregrinibacteria bacterium]